MTKVIEIKDVTYKYEGEVSPVWEHLSCNFYKNKIHAVIGPSGCGKSSLLNLVNGLIPHFQEGNLEGSVVMNGEDITSLPPAYRCDKIGLVMQNPDSQFCTFTVEEELAFGMENLGVPVEEIGARIKEVLELIDMSGWEERELTKLSGGQKQKIAIASILVLKPEVLLLDEPTANLDPSNRKQIFDLILKLAKNENMTIIIVEHNIAEIIDDVDRVICLSRDGRIVIDDDRKNVTEKQLEDCGVKIKTLDKYLKLDTNPIGKKKIVEIKDIDFAYPIPGKKNVRGRRIINNLSLDINDGDFMAIIGENGVGKTTLMKLIFRILKPEKGEVLLYGKNINEYKVKDLYHKIGLVFQNPEEQFITNTVYDEMMFSFKNVDIAQEEKEQRIDDMLKRFHLENEKEKNPFVLSQGQKRRLSVACMLLTNQSILFLDEPTFGQDYENRQELMQDMQRLVADGITIVMITHDMELVKQYATRVVKIEEGTVKEDSLCSRT